MKIKSSKGEILTVPDGMEEAAFKAQAEGKLKEFADGLKERMKSGGMIKRKDGSYSRRGLWDNIRANKGSGRKPTKEMLKQEAKIRAKEANGGVVTSWTPGKAVPWHRSTIMGSGGKLGQGIYDIGLMPYEDGGYTMGNMNPDGLIHIPYGYATPAYNERYDFGGTLKQVGAGAFGVLEGTLDTVTGGLTDPLTDAAYKGLQKAGGSSAEEIKKQNIIHGAGEIGGAVTGALVSGNVVGGINQGLKGAGNIMENSNMNSNDKRNWLAGINMARTATGFLGGGQGNLGNINNASKMSAFAKSGVGKFSAEAGKMGSPLMNMMGGMGYGGYVRMDDGGQTGMVPINVEGADFSQGSSPDAKKGELLVKNGKIVKNYVGRPPHPAEGQNPMGNDEAPEGLIVIPKNRTAEYLEAGLIKRKQMEISLVSQQQDREMKKAKRPSKKMKEGGKASSQSMSGNPARWNAYNDPYTVVAVPDSQGLPGDSVRIFPGQRAFGKTPYMRDLGNAMGVTPSTYEHMLIPESKGRVYQDSSYMYANPRYMPIRKGDGGYYSFGMGDMGMGLGGMTYSDQLGGHDYAAEGGPIGNPENIDSMLGYGYKKGGWIQKATASIKRRGTEGVCTGSKFGGPGCPPGSRRYNLAKTFKKMARSRHADGGTIGISGSESEINPKWLGTDMGFNSIENSNIKNKRAQIEGTIPIKGPSRGVPAYIKGYVGATEGLERDMTDVTGQGYRLTDWEKAQSPVGGIGIGTYYTNPGKRNAKRFNLRNSTFEAGVNYENNRPGIYINPKVEAQYSFGGRRGTSYDQPFTVYGGADYAVRPVHASDGTGSDFNELASGAIRGTRYVGLRGNINDRRSPLYGTSIYGQYGMDHFSKQPSIKAGITKTFEMGGPVNVDRSAVYQGMRKRAMYGGGAEVSGLTPLAGTMNYGNTSDISPWQIIQGDRRSTFNPGIANSTLDGWMNNMAWNQMPGGGSELPNQRNISSPEFSPSSNYYKGYNTPSNYPYYNSLNTYNPEDDVQVPLRRGSNYTPPEYDIPTITMSQSDEGYNEDGSYYDQSSGNGQNNPNKKKTDWGNVFIDAMRVAPMIRSGIKMFQKPQYINRDAYAISLGKPALNKFEDTPWRNARGTGMYGLRQSGFGPGYKAGVSSLMTGLAQGEGIERQKIRNINAGILNEDRFKRAEIDKYNAESRKEVDEINRKMLAARQKEQAAFFEDLGKFGADQYKAKTTGSRTFGKDWRKSAKKNG